MLNAVAALLALALLGLAVLYNARYRGRPWVAYDPKPAWLRAGMYFCCCWLLSWASGAMELLVTRPFATADQLASRTWWLFTGGVYLFIVVAYAGVWSYYTVVFERPRNTAVSALFGALWGASSGQLFLSVWLLVGRLGLPEWGSWLATFLVLAAWQPNWHNIYWDHYIAPEHDTPMTQKIKALGCHIPNLAIGLTHLAVYDNYLVFVSAQVIACTAAAVAMRFPAPWVAAGPLDFAHRTAARFPRCTGYVPQDPRTDPYTPFYPGWRRSGQGARGGPAAAG